MEKKSLMIGNICVKFQKGLKFLFRTKKIKEVISCNQIISSKFPNFREESQ
jgi:hypothetical protein